MADEGVKRERPASTDAAPPQKKARPAPTPTVEYVTALQQFNAERKAQVETLGCSALLVEEIEALLTEALRFVEQVGRRESTLQGITGTTGALMNAEEKARAVDLALLRQLDAVHVRDVGKLPAPNSVLSVLRRTEFKSVYFESYASSVAAAAMNALWEVAKKCVGGDERWATERSDMLAADGAIPAALAALERWADDCFVQRAGLLLLYSCLACLEGDRETAFPCGTAVAVAVAALEDTQPVVRYVALRVLMRVCRRDDGQRAVGDTSGRAVNAVLAALVDDTGIDDDRCNLTHQKVVAVGLQALADLSASDDGGAAVLAADNVIGTVLASVQAHATDARVASYGLQLLANLAVDAAARAAVVAAEGTVSIAVAALETHASSDLVQEQATRLLTHLADSHAMDLITAGAMQPLFSKRCGDMRSLLSGAVKEHRLVLLASVHEGSQPTALRSALALLYLGPRRFQEEDCAAGSPVLRQLQCALADEDPVVRLTGASAVAHLVKVRKYEFNPSKKGERSSNAGQLYSFADAFDREEDSDTCFEVEGRTLHAHRLLLRQSLCTDVFAAMLRHDTANSHTGRVVIEGVSYAAFSLLLRYLYTGALAKTKDSPLLLEVFRASQRWLVGGLAALCAAQLVSQLSTARWAGVWELLELLAEDECGDETAKLLEKDVGSFLLCNVEGMVQQPECEGRHKELAALLLEDGYAYSHLERHGWIFDAMLSDFDFRAHF